MIGLFKKNKQRGMTCEETHPVFGVLMDTIIRPNDPKLLDAIRDRFGEYTEVSASQGRNTGSLILQVDASGFFTGYIQQTRRPVPGDLVEHACEFSYWWREAAQAVDGYKQAVIVTAEPNAAPNAPRRIWELSRLIAAICEACPVRAVFHPIANTLYSPEMWVEQVRRQEQSGEKYPMSLWCPPFVAQGKGAKPSVAYTMGADLLGLLDVELDSTPATAMRDMATVAYVLNMAQSGGAPIMHGHTIGGTAERPEFLVRIGKARYRDLEVVRLKRL